MTFNQIFYFDRNCENLIFTSSLLGQAAFTTLFAWPLNSSPLPLNSSALILISQLVHQFSSAGFWLSPFPLLFLSSSTTGSCGCWVCSLRRFKAFRPLGPLPSPQPPLHFSATTHLRFYQVCFSQFPFFFHFLHKLLGFGYPTVPSALVVNVYVLL